VRYLTEGELVPQGWASAPPLKEVSDVPEYFEPMFKGELDDAGYSLRQGLQAIETHAI
jgi:hypothetical protein